jgi:hypothetical protein
VSCRVAARALTVCPVVIVPYTESSARHEQVISKAAVPPTDVGTRFQHGPSQECLRLRSAPDTRVSNVQERTGQRYVTVLLHLVPLPSGLFFEVYPSPYPVFAIASVFCPGLPLATSDN